MKAVSSILAAALVLGCAAASPRKGESPSR
jgi:hypothetical protein